MATNKSNFSHILDQVSACLSLLGETGVLPPLRDIEVRRIGTGARWTVKAYVGGINGYETAAEAITAVEAYAKATGSDAAVRDSYPSTVQPSGTQVSLATSFWIDGVPVEVRALLDGDEYAAAIAAARKAPLAVDARVKVIKDRLSDEIGRDTGQRQWVGREGVVRIIQEPGDWPSVSVLLDGDTETSVWSEDELEVIPEEVLADAGH